MSEKPRKSKKSKAAPVAMSCKKPTGGVSFFQDDAPRTFDPRFNEDCGEIDKISYVRNYAFLQQNREADIQRLAKNKDVHDPNVQKQLQSLKDQHKTFQEKISEANDSIQWHNEERERIKMGKKPFWITKKEMKEMQNQKKFAELKESGKLNKYLQKRRKKISSKDKKSGFMHP